MATHFDWERIRADYSFGVTQNELSRRYGVSRAAIQKHIKAEAWTQDVTAEIDRLTEAKVAGVVAGCDPQKKAEALNAAADKKTAVIKRHQTEWDGPSNILQRAIDTDDFELAKLAKITMEALKIKQDGERKAYGIIDKTQVEARIESALTKEQRDASVEAAVMMEKLDA